MDDDDMRYTSSAVDLASAIGNRLEYVVAERALVRARDAGRQLVTRDDVLAELDRAMSDIRAEFRQNAEHVGAPLVEPAVAVR